MVLLCPKTMWKLWLAREHLTWRLAKDQEAQRDDLLQRVHRQGRRRLLCAVAARFVDEGVPRCCCSGGRRRNVEGFYEPSALKRLYTEKGEFLEVRLDAIWNR